MANAVPSRPGQVDLAGDAKALFLKKFAGEVLAAFTETNTAQSRHMVRSITEGKSAQFPAIGKTVAAYHTPGTELVGQTIAHNERVISIDDVLISDVFIANIDEAMSHYEFRSEYVKQCAAALSRTFDTNVYRVIGLAARATATVTGGNGGTAITDADALTNADSLIESIFAAAEAMDEKDVPEGDRFVAVKPEQYYKLVNSSSKLIHSDYNPQSNGGYAQGKVFRVAGMEIVKTNNLPQTNLATGPTAYQGNFTTCAALCWHRSAAGTVKLWDISTEMKYQMERQGTLLLAKYAVGHGILRPESAVEIKTA